MGFAAGCTEGVGRGTVYSMTSQWECGEFFRKERGGMDMTGEETKWFFMSSPFRGLVGITGK